MHIPVLLKEVLQILDPGKGRRYIDATFGMGGHSKAIAARGAEVLGIDEDPSLKPKRPGARIKFVSGSFAELRQIAGEQGFQGVDGILFDLGIGSHQLDNSKRGFSFQKTGILDMRFNQNGERPEDSKTAASILSSYSEKELWKIFLQFGEEKRFGKRIARAIVQQRKSGEGIATTTELFDLIKQALPAKFRFRAGDTARRIFQALRIEVNQELSKLETALPQALQILKKDGVLAVISFHSLEDRIVKKFFTQKSRACICPPEFPICRCGGDRAEVKILTKKPIQPSAEEIKTNSRAKSAKLRAAIKIK